VHRLLLHVMTLWWSLLLSLLLRQHTSLGHSLEILLGDLLKVSLVGLLLMVRHLGSPGVLEIGGSRIFSSHGRGSLVVLLRGLSISLLQLVLLHRHLWLKMSILGGLLLVLLNPVIHDWGSVMLRLLRLLLLRDLALGGNSRVKLWVLICLH
jgi:hypothetical protein